MPTVMVLKDGRVLGQIVGAVPRARLEALVSRALGSEGVRAARVAV